MKTPHRPLSLMALAGLALALSACGGSPTLPEVSAAAPSETELVTLRVGPSVTGQALRALRADAQVLLLDHQTGRAVVAMPKAASSATLRAASVSALNLGALDATVLATETDTVVELPGEAEAQGLTTWAGGALTWAGGATTWAGGALTWAGGALTWAGGTSFLEGNNLSDAQAYWNRVGIYKAHTLMGEMGAGVKVAVIDTGVDLTHPLLKNSLETTNDWDFVDNDGVATDAQSPSGNNGKYGHGTAAAGIILQVAPKATILPYRALKADGSGNLSHVIAAINGAITAGAKVINLSLGSARDSAALNNTIGAALAKGIAVVNSAGNAGTEGMVFPSRNLNTATFSATSGLIGVGSVDKDGKKSSFSQYAGNMSLTAPGEQVLTIFPDGRLIKATGTSFAAPAVSGAVALAMSAGVSNLGTLATGLRSSTTANQDLTFNPKLGTGMLNVGAFADLYR